MAKRQVRVAKDNLEGHIAKATFLSFVMVNCAVYLARPLQLKSETLKVKNTKGHILHLPMAQIDEIWAEELATDT